ncbi:MAG: hypothetical protein ACTHU0_11135 [Kofleriaceae bacterium]
MSDRALNELRIAGEELRRLFAEERAAIAALDHGALERLAAQKLEVARTLAELRDQVTDSPVLRALFASIRVEARATSVLAAAATESVRALLGYDQGTGGYDRRARQVTTQSSRLLVSY